MQSIELPETVPVAMLAELFGVSSRQARNILEGAKVKPRARGQWPMAEAVRAVLAQARESREPDLLSAARARALNARARAQEVALARQERELIPVEEFNAVMDITMREIVSALTGLPARITRDMQVRHKIEDELHMARKRMAASMVAAATQLRLDTSHGNEEDAV